LFSFACAQTHTHTQGAKMSLNTTNVNSNKRTTQRHSIIGVCELQAHNNKTAKQRTKKSKILNDSNHLITMADKLNPLRDLYDGMSNYFTPTGRRNSRNPMHTMHACDQDEMDNSKCCRLKVSYSPPRPFRTSH
jgi:hypothetical protein